MTYSKLRGLVAALSFQTLTIACVTNQETDRKQLIFMPKDQVQDMGLQAYQEMKKSSPTLAETSPGVKQIIEIGERIAKASGTEFNWEFSVFKDDQMVNAFCLPGGKVGVYTGILPVAETNAGLAAVLAHEVAHATLRHGAERMSQAAATQAGVSLAALTLEDSEYKGLVLASLGVGMQVGFTLPYSRLHETEADIIGLKYMAKAGYDPEASVELWQRMAKQSGERSQPEFLSTHPAPLERAKKLEKELHSVAPLYQKSRKAPTEKLLLLQD